MNLEEFDEMRDLFKMIGFWHTLKVLKEYITFYQKGDGILLEHFYRILNHFSYHNAFLRVRDDLIRRNIIEMPIELSENKRIKYIKLTKKGIKIYEILKLLDENIKS
jgi:hypothetical protein